MSAFWRGFEKAAADKGIYAKRTYGESSIHDLDPHNPGEVWSAKIDGAHALIEMTKGEVPRLFSHRVSKKTGDQIPYNPKLAHVTRPSPMTGLFRGEVYAIGRDGHAVHPDVVTQVLNSGAEKSHELQKRLGIRTVTALIDVDRVGERDMTAAPYGEKLKIMRQVVAANPDFHLPDLAHTASEKQELRRRIVGGSHPQTKEGMVVHQLEGPAKFSKAKLSDDHDVYIRSVFMEEPTKEGRPAGMAGGFHYSWEPDGPIAGKVGTGFDHATKRDMAENPHNYVGKVAKVRALSVSKNRALMKPSYGGLHVDKNLD